MVHLVFTLLNKTGDLWIFLGLLHYIFLLVTNLSNRRILRVWNFSSSAAM